MTAHSHSTFIPDCFRCDLSRDEVATPHACDEVCDSWGCDKPDEVTVVQGRPAEPDIEW